MFYFITGQSCLSSIWNHFKGKLRLKIISESKRNCSTPEMHLEPTETSKMELFAKTVTSWKLLPFSVKSCISDIWLGSEQTSSFCQNFAKLNGKHTWRNPFFRKGPFRTLRDSNFPITWLLMLAANIFHKYQFSNLSRKIPSVRMLVKDNG